MPEDASKCWTWQKFNQEVDALCPLESKRIFGAANADGSSVFYRNQIRQAVLDLMDFIPEFTKNHETIYYPQDFVPDGHASVGTLPPMSKTRSAWYFNTEKQTQRFQVKEMPWEHRFEMTTRKLHDSLGDIVVLTAAALMAAETIELLTRRHRPHAALMAISPQHERFYLFPEIHGPWIFSLFWDGKKLAYRDQEQVPFEEEAAAAAAYFVQAQFLRYVDREPGLAAAAMTEYHTKRTNLYTTLNSKGRIK